MLSLLKLARALSEWVSEWVSSFLTAHQHIRGHLVPYKFSVQEYSHHTFHIYSSVVCHIHGSSVTIPLTAIWSLQMTATNLLLRRTCQVMPQLCVCAEIGWNTRRAHTTLRCRMWKTLQSCLGRLAWTAALYADKPSLIQKRPTLQLQILLTHRMPLRMPLEWN